MFKHQPLDLTKQQIRLLRLHPTPENEDAQTSPIQCDVTTVDAKDAVYTTLSYVWGPPSPNQTIQVNGELFVVRQNLFDFLKVFRDDPANRTLEPLYLWIDQLCIDQDNDLERNHQVHMMSDIYRRCQYVIVWLHGPWKGIARVFKKASLPSALKNIFAHEYFTRLWIVQEILLPPCVEVLCDNVWISWDQMKKRYHEYFQLLPSPFADLEPHEAPYQPIYWLTHPEAPFLSKFSEIDLHTCVEKFMKLECQLRHDKVYGLLGLVKPEQRPTVDYNKTIEQVFVDFLSIALRFCSILAHSGSYRYNLCKTVCSCLGLRFSRGLGQFCRDICNIEKMAVKAKGLKTKISVPYLIEEVGFIAANESSHDADAWWFKYKCERYLYLSNDDPPGPGEFREKRKALVC